MEIIDKAQALIELTLEQNIKRARGNKLNYQPTGKCLNCDEILAHGRWCDADCRDDFLKRVIK